MKNAKKYYHFKIIQNEIRLNKSHIKIAKISKYSYFPSKKKKPHTQQLQGKNCTLRINILMFIAYFSDTIYELLYYVMFQIRLLFYFVWIKFIPHLRPSGLIFRIQLSQNYSSLVNIIQVHIMHHVKIILNNK